jgi:CRISPR-associated protein Cas2
MFYAISYDISNDSRRNSISKILERYGTRVQYSLFECNLDIDKLTELLQKLEEIVKADEDSLRCYSMCNSCLENVRRVGGPPITRDSAFFVV